ncbi:MAG: 16S rRNA (guanine(527)-N(7))-methyltransferase RsmG [Pseudomonadota bacterium]
MTPGERLDHGLAQLGLTVTPDARRCLLDFVALLLHWNRVTNLTAVRDPIAVVDRHILDCAAVLPYVHGERVLDLGSGGGLPGVILAILSPQWQLTLLDGNGKKTRFLTQAAISLSLDNVVVVNARAESWQNGRDFDTVISRAFTDLAAFTRMATAFVRPQGTIVAMVGKKTGHTLGEAIDDCTVVSVDALRVPYTDGERHVVRLQRSETATP